MRFHKYQALGNDYLVLETEASGTLSQSLVRRVCDRHFGIGSDGILLAGPQTAAGFPVRIYNPDGSEAEKSGNGLRIFARYLWDARRVGSESFAVVTKGGVVRCEVRDGGRQVAAEMGQASFDSAKIPVNGPHREVVGEQAEVGGERLTFTAVTVGNPHCVVHTEAVSAALVQQIGPVLEHHPLFPNRTNVQLVEVINRNRIKIEIWERGAGYTLASGTSSCAAAAASVRLGMCDGEITVAMPGGELAIVVSPSFSVRMTGPVAKVADGAIAADLLREAGEPEEVPT